MRLWLALFICLSPSAHAAEILKSTKKAVLVQFDPFEENFVVGDKWIALKDGKKQALISVTKIKGGKWLGQDQDWFVARFMGDDDDIDIATAHPEFREWKWVAPADLPDVIVPFKRDLYRQLLADFAPYL